MIDTIQEKLKRIELMAKTLAEDGERLNDEIRQMEIAISKFSLPFDVGVMIGDNEHLYWNSNKKLLGHIKGNEEGMRLSSASIPTRRKAIQNFPVLLDAIAEKIADYSKKYKIESKSKKVIQTEIAQEIMTEEPPEGFNLEKVKKRRGRKASRVYKVKSDEQKEVSN
jgi:hypothetical protein